jgi:hypothetical protein
MFLLIVARCHVILSGMAIQNRWSGLAGWLRQATIVPALLAIVLAFVGGLAVSRLLYEALFPQAALLSRPLPVFLFGAVTAVLGGVLFRWLERQQSSSWTALIPFLPLALNLLYLTDPAVALIRSRLLFGLALWAAILLNASRLAPRFSRLAPRASRLAPYIWPIILILPIYLLTIGRVVGRADVFEFQVVAHQLGIAHPTGYPLFLLLGKLFTFLPISAVAWRVNFSAAVYALATVSLLVYLGWRLHGRYLPALLAAVAFALTPTFWSQAIEAEVYTLHTLFVTAALLIMIYLTMDGGRWTMDDGRRTMDGGRWFVLLFGLIGLSLTNHLTTLFLLPAAGLTLLFVYPDLLRPSSWRGHLPFLLKLAAALLLPLLLYLYLPIRWQMVNGEPMGLARFVDWVVGGRFQESLQWQAWLRDPTRWEVIGRLFLAEWRPWQIIMAGGGLLYLFWRNWRAALLTLVTGVGYTFYCLNYYVPDLNVFLLPAQLIIALAWGAAVAALFPDDERPTANDERPATNDQRDWFFVLRPSSLVPRPLPLVLWLVLLAVIGLRTAALWPQVDRSGDTALAHWGRAVLAQPLAADGAILADSEKIAPLYYLQQVEGLRPDMDIMVLPDEAAYRAELDGRIAAGQTVYLARFLPGLEGVYHLRSAGPLLEVRATPVTDDRQQTAARGRFGEIALLDWEIELEAAVDPAQTAVTFYWQTAAPLTQTQHIYLRWFDPERGQPYPARDGQHPAGNYYPTVAWRPGEIVSDYHLLPRPILPYAATLELQLAWGRPFSRPADLAWQTVGEIHLPATNPDYLPAVRPWRSQIGPLALRGSHTAAQIRPESDLSLMLIGYGSFKGLTLRLIGEDDGSVVTINDDAETEESVKSALSIPLDTHLPNGRYQIFASYPGETAVCGWLARPTDGCVLGELEISGVPLPDDAINFEDKIALLAVELGDVTLTPGGQLFVTFTWQGLAAMSENYTVFAQVLDENDRLAGQVDAWPLQGTYPTGQWRPGEVVRDPYLIHLDANLQPGSYRLIVGWYLLGTLRRLPVLDEMGTAVGDHFMLPGLTAGEE